MTYDLACKQATTQQGLDPVLAMLAEAKIDHGLEQTGGFTMVVTVPYAGGILGITQDRPADHRSPTYLLVDYPGDTWVEGGDEASVTIANDTAILLRRINNVIQPRQRYKRGTHA